MRLPMVTVATSAFLLFLLQPLVARQLLPMFGGSASVWTTCLVFFQTMLLVGYGYSDLLARRLAPRTQALVHALLLLASLAFLPLALREPVTAADGTQPIRAMLVLLLVTVGAPYTVLATTAPLIQAWAARGPRAEGAYRLYALSNLGSLGALLAFPTLVEPRASSGLQSIGWSLGYLAFVLMALAACWQVWRTGAGASPRTPASSRPDEVERSTDASAAVKAPGLRLQLTWLSLAMLGSVLLLSVTAHLTRDIAPVPFLWILPLIVYLASFILCFGDRHWYWPRTWAAAGLLMAVTMFMAMDAPTTWSPAARLGLQDSAWIAVPLHVGGLFALCMFCHGELVRRRPAPGQLTRFQLMIALGGALGGVVVGIVAPLGFSWYWELPGALTAFTLAVLLLADWSIRPLGLVALGTALFLFVDYRAAVQSEVVEIRRNFYGPLRVTEFEHAPGVTARRLLHGGISHGMQARTPELADRPTLYYVESSGVGRALGWLAQRASDTPLRVGLVGLGTGTLATYGRPGDTFRFYEIDPDVIALARSHFSFLSSSRATVETALGDARLSLEREAPQGFDLLAIDAFSGDAIPVHLLTREAALAYRRHLREDGVIAIHISNRYLDLTGISRQLADAIGWQAWLVEDDPAQKAPALGSRSDWVLITRNTDLLEALRRLGVGRALPPETGRAWTDDFNSLLPVLKVGAPRTHSLPAQR